MRAVSRKGLLCALQGIDRLVRDRKGDLQPLSESKRFLFLQYEVALGTAVHATPTFVALKQAIPGAFIAIACSGVSCEVLKHNPHIDLVIETANPHASLARATLQLLRALRSGGYRFDCVVTDSGNQKTRFAAMGLVARARWRVGFTNGRELYHETLQYDFDRSVIDNNLQLLRLLGREERHVEPNIYFCENELAAADEFLSEHGLDDERPLVAFVTQTSKGQPTRWFDGRFAEVADRIIDLFGCQVVFIGAGSEADAIDGIRRKMKRKSVSVAGYTTISQLAALLCRCDLAVAVDTGAMQVGRAVRLPMVVIAATWQPAHEWLPLNKRDITILRRSEALCPRCGKAFCTTQQCMEIISVSHVIEAVETMLRRCPPSVEDRHRRVANSLSRRLPNRSTS